MKNVRSVKIKKRMKDIKSHSLNNKKIEIIDSRPEIRKNNPKIETSDIDGTWNSDINMSQNKMNIKIVSEVEEMKKDKKLDEEWILWTHSLTSNDWSLKGYKKIFTIRTVGDFWRVFNNFSKIGPDCFHVYLMKDGITPMWEDNMNRNGGICSLKIDFDKSYSEYEEICKRVILDKLLIREGNDVNGVSFSPKINSRCSFAIIKIWNGNSKNNLIDLLDVDLKKRYSKKSIQYKDNIPEY